MLLLTSFQVVRAFLVIIAVTVGITRQPVFTTTRKQLLLSSDSRAPPDLDVYEYDNSGHNADLPIEHSPSLKEDLILNQELNSWTEIPLSSKNLSMVRLTDYDFHNDQDVLIDPFLYECVNKQYPQSLDVCPESSDDKPPIQQVVSLPQLSYLSKRLINTFGSFTTPLITSTQSRLTNFSWRIFDLSLSTEANQLNSLSSMQVVQTFEYDHLSTAQSVCGLICHHERFRLYLRNVLLSSLPKHWAEWINSNRLTLSVIGITLMHGFVLWTFMFVLWSKVKHKKIFIQKLSKSNGACQILESYILELQMDNDDLAEQLRQDEALSNMTLSSDLTNLQALVNELKETNKQLEVENQRLDEEKKLVKLAKQDELKNHIERNMTLSSDLTNLQALVNELEETNEQLEVENQRVEEESKLVKHAKLYTIKALTALQAKHQQSKNELVAAREEHVKMENQFSNLNDELALKNTKVLNLERKLKELSNCQTHHNCHVDDLLPQVSSREKCLQQCNKAKQLFTDIQGLSEQMNQEINMMHATLHENTKSTVEKEKVSEKVSSFSELFESDVESVGISIGDEVNTQIDITRRTLERYELLEFEAQEKCIILEEKVDEQRSKLKELKPKQSQLSEQKVEKSKHGITDIKTRLTDPVPKHNGRVLEHTPRCPSPLLLTVKSISTTQSKPEFGSISPELTLLCPTSVSEPLLVEPNVGD